MDGYLQCLIRRLSGQFYSHTIQSPARMRANLYDPFENNAVRPLQYPESQTTGTPAPADHMEKASSDIRYPKSDDPQLPVIGPPGVSPKTGSKRVDKGDLSSSIHLKDRELLPVSESFRRRSTSRVRKTMVQKQSKSRKNIGVFILDIYRPISNKDLKHFQEMNHSVKS